MQVVGMLVVMVGDGINDLLVLVVVDVGMVIGVGMDIVIEVVDIVLMKSNLEDVIIGIDLLWKLFFRIWLNYVWVLGYNVLGIFIVVGVLFLSMGFWLFLWVVGVVMVVLLVLVVCLLLWLKCYKRLKVVEEIDMSVQWQQVWSMFQCFFIVL